MFDENKFWELLNMWKYQTALLSSSTKILSHPSVAEIIAMGPEAIPTILKALPDHWFLSYTLHKLTSEWPVKDEYRGNGKKIIECWLSWGKKHGYQV